MYDVVIKKAMCKCICVYLCDFMCPKQYTSHDCINIQPGEYSVGEWRDCSRESLGILYWITRSLDRENILGIYTIRVLCYIVHVHCTRQNMNAEAIIWVMRSEGKREWEKRARGYMMWFLPGKSRRLASPLSPRDFLALYYLCIARKLGLFDAIPRLFQTRNAFQTFASFCYTNI